MAREVKPIRIPQFQGGMNLHDNTTIEDNQLSEAENISYGNDGLPHKRLGVKTFGAAIGTDAVMSIYFYEESDGTRHLLATSGDKIYKYTEGTAYNNGTWSCIRDGLVSGRRFGFETYKDVAYFCNATDSYMSWSGSGSASAHTQSNTVKGRYIKVANDVGYITGAEGAPSTVYYTDGTPTNLQTFSNSVIVDEDNGQVNTGIQTLGPYVICGKERSMYRIDIATPAIEQVDYGGGVNAGRTMIKAENNMYFLSDEGTYTLAQRQGVAGSFRAKSRSDDIHDRLKNLENKTERAGIYFPKKRRLYFSINDGGDNNNKILVYDLRLSGVTNRDVWTEYTGINANDFTIYRESDGTEHLLYADSYTGQVYEMECDDTYTDNGSSYEAALSTKSFDYGFPDYYKETRFATIEGYISEPTELVIEAYGDDDDSVITQDTILGSSFVDDSDFYVFNDELGVQPYGGESETVGTVVYKFKVRLNLGVTSANIRLRFTEQTAGGFFQITNATLAPDPLTADYFPTDSIY
jgi:hypothetical protein